MPNILHNKKDIPGSYICVPCSADCHLDVQRHPQSQSRSCDGMLYFPWQPEFGAQDKMQNSNACFHLLSEIIISAPSRIALHNMPHPACMAQRRSRSNDVGRKKSTVSCGTSLSGQYEILLRSSPVGGGDIYFCRISQSLEKCCYNRIMCSATV